MHRFIWRPTNGALPLCFDFPASRLKLLHYPNMGGYCLGYLIGSSTFRFFFLSVIMEAMARDSKGINGCVYVFSLARAVYKRGAELRSLQRFQHDCHPPQGGPPYPGGQQTNHCEGGSNGNSAHRRGALHCRKVLLTLIKSTFTLKGSITDCHHWLTGA